MFKIICDICKENEAYKGYVTKRKNFFWDYAKWEKVDICEECHEKIFGQPKKTIPPKGKSAVSEQ